MLREFTRVRQEKSGYRRLFTDEDFELYLWYDRNGGRLTGFQLCYNKRRDTHALTWLEEKGFLHSRVEEDSGFHPGAKQTAVLMPDGQFDNDRIAVHFRFAARHLEHSVADFVYAKIKEYTREQEDPFL